MRVDGAYYTYYKFKITNVDIGGCFGEDKCIFYHYLEKLLEIDPRVSKGPTGPFIRDLNELVEVEATDPAPTPVEKSKGKREAMNPPATRGRLARDPSSKKKRQERRASPPQDEFACEPLTKRKSPSPSGDQTTKDPTPQNSKKKVAPYVGEESTVDHPAQKKRKNQTYMVPPTVAILEGSIAPGGDMAMG
ncbi:hypothetical protein AMTR_s00064p00171270 [Amborella trichopoda]|uniref:Uncharacterized protein n=1 Tax=Amborella trichopoda TaxID=13333 RepID=U5DC59_AMBTC|nr:hypothetical protein AMTR_s00064p00171270 [Amborella trichopoda]